MCGLFGAKSNTFLGKSERENFVKLGVYSTFRGWHSTGVCIGQFKKKKQVNYEIRKGVVSPWNFFTQKETQDAIGSGSKFLLLGHNRSATIGDINHENAHPYWEGPIVGAHNGTVNAFNPKDGKKSTDSRELIKFLAENDIKQTAIKAEHGAFALTWTDRRDGSFNMARNDRRPLWIMLDHSQNTLYWASTDAILNHMAEEAEWGAKMGNPILLKEYVHYKYELDGLEPEEFDIKPPVRVYHHTPYTGSRIPFVPDVKPTVMGPPPAPAATGKTLKERAAEMAQRRTEEYLASAKEMEAYRGFSYKIIPINRVKVILDAGCAHCTNSLKFTDKVWWYTEDDCVCDNCTKHDLVREVVGYGKKLYEGIYMTKHKDMVIEQKYRYFVNNNKV